MSDSVQNLKVFFLNFKKKFSLSKNNLQVKDIQINYLVSSIIDS